jgi:hypothetical protein
MYLHHVGSDRQEDFDFCVGGEEQGVVRCLEMRLVLRRLDLFIMLAGGVVSAFGVILCCVCRLFLGVTYVD